MRQLTLALVLLVGMAFNHSAHAAPPCTDTLNATENATLGRQIDHTKWLVCRVVRANLGKDAPNAIAVLLRSAKPTSDSEYDVDMELASAGKRLYAFGGPGYFMDNTLEVRDLSSVGVPAIVFHSGRHGAVCDSTAVHVIVLAPGNAFASDVSPNTFGDFCRQHFHWENIAGQPLAVVAEPVVPASTNDPHWGQASAHYYQYLVYRWQPKWLSFQLWDAIDSQAAYSVDDPNPIDAEEALIHQAVERKASGICN